MAIAPIPRLTARQGHDPRKSDLSPPPNLPTHVVQGGVLLGGQRLVGLTVSGLGSIFLARWLTPEIFGTYAILWFCIALAINVSEMGLTAALLLQPESRLRKELPSVATAQLLVMVALAAAMAATTPVLIDWLGLGPEAAWPLRAMAVLLPLSALRLVPAVKLERRLYYMPLTIADTIDTIVFYSVAVAAAYAGAGLWSFVIGILVGRVTSITSLWVREPWWPILPIPWGEWRCTIRRGWAFQSTAMLVQAREAVAPILVRHLAGVPAVGLLNLASALALQTVQMTNVATRVLFPTFVRLREDDAAFGAACERALNRVAVIIVPATRSSVRQPTRLFVSSTVQVGPRRFHRFDSFACLPWQVVSPWWPSMP